MKHTARIVIKPGFGTYRQPFAYDLATDVVWKRALRQGLVTGLERIQSSDEAKNQSAIRLSHTAQFFTEYTAGTWNCTSGDGINYLTDVPDPFGYGAGVSWQNCAANNIAGAQSNSFTIDANGAHSIVAFIARPSSQQIIKLWTYRWANYQFQIRDGRAEMMRLAPGWNQSDEDTLNELLAQHSATADEQTAINNYLTELYLDYKKLDLGSGEAFYNQPFALTFLPEPSGRVSVILEGKKEVAHENSTIVATRRVGVLWPRCMPAVRSQGGAFFWQVGTPLFARSGNLMLFVSDPDGIWYDGLADLTANYKGCDISNPGTNVVMTYQAINAVSFYLVLTLTGDSTSTPFCYWAQALIPSGQVTASGTVLWDSDANLDKGGHTIVEVAPAFDGFDRKRQYTVTLRDVNGALTPLWFNYSFYENCLADLYIDGAVVLTGGVIVASNQKNLGNVAADQARVFATRPDTQVEMTITDHWTILEESELLVDPIGDGMTLPAYIQLILQTIGYPSTAFDAHVVEASGLLANLPAAAFGERPAIRPALRGSAAQWIRDLVGKYGGLQDLCFHQNDIGIWTLEYFPANWASYGGYPALFSTTASLNNCQTYPGRLACVMPIDMRRDYGEFYNFFSVTGADGPDGAPLTAQWTDQLSVGAANGPNILNWMGRIKPFHAERDLAWRTQDDVNAAVRSLVFYHNRNPLFFALNTYYHPALRPRDRISVAGSWTCEVVRVLSASAQNDTMSVLVRVLNAY